MQMDKQNYLPAKKKFRRTSSFAYLLFYFYVNLIKNLH
jgi:hypothetical protein